MKRWLMVAAALLLSMAFALPASAHATRSSEEPEEGSRLDEGPGHLYINFTEPPTAEFQLTVTDGCGRDLVSFNENTQQALHAVLNPGQPGKWEVEYTVISGLDGHRTAETYSFRVKGETDCDAPQETPSGDGPDAAPPRAEGGSFPWAIAAAGAAVLIGGAIVLRSRTGS